MYETSKFRICHECGQVYGWFHSGRNSWSHNIPPGVELYQDCDRNCNNGYHRDDAPQRRINSLLWPGFSQNRIVTFCACCGIDRAGSRQAGNSYFCEECHDLVYADFKLHGAVRIPWSDRSNMIVWRPTNHPGEIDKLLEAQHARIDLQLLVAHHGFMMSMYSMDFLGYPRGIDPRVNEFIELAEDRRLDKRLAFQHLLHYMKNLGVGAEKSPLKMMIYDEEKRILFDRLPDISQGIG